MPFYPGGDIAWEGKHDPRRVQRYMSHVARAVKHLHRFNIAHNDIKLENVFVDASDRAHLGDFGLALKMEDGVTTADADFVGGTMGYLPPEKTEGATKQDKLDPFKVRTLHKFFNHLFCFVCIFKGILCNGKDFFKTYTRLIVSH
ncbi:protein kinase [Elysia marginata]|uniref:Protein kinase n=1 Tax=Elysia marginata TaxID=1093978 RepID=A0AAV4EBF2_9GAST|nr:protein kinase [Elysia marginata]